MLSDQTAGRAWLSGQSFRILYRQFLNEIKATNYIQSRELDPGHKIRKLGMVC